MEPADIYAASRVRLLELASSLPAASLDVPLHATPPWVLVDGYRHVAGVCADVLDGALEGAGTPEWTAAQLAARSTLTLDEVCSEWARRGPDLDERVAAAGRAMAFVAFDTWTHEQDIRAAAGVMGARDEVATPLAAIALESFNGRYTSSGAPTVAVAMGEQPSQLGAGTPTLTLSTSPYEVLRMIFGRRSREQMAAAGWSGDGADAAIDALHLFPLPAVDIID